MCRLTPAATAVPPATARLPPSQKSFWTSTTISARGMENSFLSGLVRRPAPSVRGVRGTGSFRLSGGHSLQHRLPAGQRPGLLRQRLAHPLVVRPGPGEGVRRTQLLAELAGPQQGGDEVAVAVPGGD